MLVVVIGLLCQAPNVLARWNSATQQDEMAMATAQDVWSVAETCSSADDEVTALDETERTFKIIQALILTEGDTTDKNGEIEFVLIPKWANGARFRAIGIADNGDYITEIRAGTLGTSPSFAIATGTYDSDTAIVGTLTWKIGTQVSTVTDYELADAVTVVSTDWTFPWRLASAAGDDTAEAEVDLGGADFLVISPTTCTADSKLLIKFF